MKNEHYLMQAGKKLRMGYTTGSCAAAGTKAALKMLFSKEVVSEVILDTPKGIRLYLDVENISFKEDQVSCSIKKDGGDDPDATHGLDIVATVRKQDEGVSILGGKGVGVVTKKGLEQSIGDPAINKVPREMIRKEIRELCKEFQYDGGIEVVISVPGGEEVGRKTFNPNLGIMGGISILGTSGIVMPMSESALIKSIELEMNMALVRSSTLLICPGNYGEAFSKKLFGRDKEPDVKCSNFVGETLDLAMGKDNLKQVLFVAHIGKFVKLAAGIMNTHSRNADGRAEVLAAHTAMVTEDLETIRRIMGSNTTEEALEILEEKGLLGPVIDRLIEKIIFYIEKRIQKKYPVAVVLFSSQKGWLGESNLAQEMIMEIRKNEG